MSDEKKDNNEDAPKRPIFQVTIMFDPIEHDIKIVEHPDWIIALGMLTYAVAQVESILVSSEVKSKIIQASGGFDGKIM